MNLNELNKVALAMVTPGKGILAADESMPTITKRFEAVGIESSENSRRAYRTLLCATPGAGASAFVMKSLTFGDHLMMSTFSLLSSRTMFFTRAPRMPTQAPTGSTEESREITAIFAREPGSRATALTSTMPSYKDTLSSGELADLIRRALGIASPVWIELLGAYGIAVDAHGHVTSARGPAAVDD